MKQRRVPQSLLDFLKKQQSFFVIGHKDPDGDCIGSQLAMGSLLRRMGKNVRLLNVGPFKKREAILHAPEFSAAPLAGEGGAGWAAVVLDCSSLDRIGALSEVVAFLPTSVIDHHAAGGDLGSVRFIDAKAPSTTELVLQVFLELGFEPSQEEARNLFFGLATDTGFFRFLGKDSGEALRSAARLVDCGAVPRDIHHEVFGNRHQQALGYLSALMSRITSHFDGQVLITTETSAQAAQFAEEARETDTLYQLMLNQEKVEAIAFLREEKPGKTVVSLRSNRFVNVSAVAASYGGGGHIRAAGFSWNGTPDELKPLLLKALGEALTAQGTEASQ